MRRFFAILSAVLVVGVAIIATLAKRASTPTATTTSLGAPQGSAAAPMTLAGIRWTSPTGVQSSISPTGGGVVIIALSTCPHCHKVLGAFSSAAHGQPYGHLSVVVVDGADKGRAMLDSMGLKAPVGDFGTPAVRDSLIGALKLEGVPAFFKVDAAGRVLGTQVGEMSLESLSPWISAAR